MSFHPTFSRLETRLFSWTEGVFLPCRWSEEALPAAQPMKRTVSTVAKTITNRNSGIIDSP